MKGVQPLAPVGRKQATEARGRIFDELNRRGFPGVLTAEARPWSLATIGQVFGVSKNAVARGVRSARLSRENAHVPSPAAEPPRP